MMFFHLCFVAPFALLAQSMAIIQPTVAPLEALVWLDRTDLFFTLKYWVDEPDPRNWIGVHRGDKRPQWAYAPDERGIVSIPAGEERNGVYTVGFYKKDNQNPVYTTEIILPDIRFRTKSITLKNAREGSAYEADVGGLINAGKKEPAFSKRTGPDWVTVGDDGVLSGTPPDGSAGDNQLIVRADLGWTSDLVVTIPVREKGDCLVQDVRVMTYNMWNGALNVDSGHDKALRAIIESNADIVGFQEANDERAHELARDLGWSLRAIGDMLIASRYPMVQPETLSKNVVAAKIRLDDDDDDERQQLVVWNIHLKEDNYGPDAVCAGTDHDDNSKAIRDGEYMSGRPEQLGAILREMQPWIKDKYFVPLVLLGTFNAPSDLDYTEAQRDRNCGSHGEMWPTSKLAMDAGFVDSYREVHPDPRQWPGTTFTPLEDGQKERIDFIYYTGSNITAVMSDVLFMGDPAHSPNQRGNLWTSDHAAVVSDLRLNDGTCPPKEQ